MSREMHSECIIQDLSTNMQGSTVQVPPLQATTSTDIIAIVLIEQIRKEIKVPWLLLSKRPGERRIREEDRKKKGLGIAVAWPNKKKKKKRMSMLRNQK